MIRRIFQNYSLKIILTFIPNLVLSLHQDFFRSSTAKKSSWNLISCYMLKDDWSTLWRREAPFLRVKYKIRRAMFQRYPTLPLNNATLCFCIWIFLLIWFFCFKARTIEICNSIVYSEEIYLHQRYLLFNWEICKRLTKYS